MLIHAFQDVQMLQAKWQKNDPIIVSSNLIFSFLPVSSMQVIASTQRQIGKTFWHSLFLWQKPMGWWASGYRL